MNEKFNYRLLRDLFGHKEAIFGELKRASSQANRAVADSSGVKEKARGRGMSSNDERGRQFAEQERRQAIAANGRSRGMSPAPGDRRSIKRERSPNRMSGDATTRFPVSPSAGAFVHSPTGSTTSPTERRSTLVRHSLEVPGSAEGSPVIDNVAVAKTNGSLAKDEGLTKRDSLGRAGAGFGGRRAAPGIAARQSLYGGAAAHRDSVSSITGAGADLDAHRGVELSDRPMDD
jgi:hypothetical protein